MIPRSKRKKKGTVFLVAGILFLLPCLALVFADFKMLGRRNDLSDQIRGLEEQAAGLEAGNAKLQERIAKAEDKEYIEKVLREEQNMQKPGEKVVSFVQPESQPYEPDSKAPKPQGIAAWFAGILQNIKNVFR